MSNLPDLWDEDAVVKWLSKEIEEALLELLARPEPIRYNAQGKLVVEQTIISVFNPYA